MSPVSLSLLQVTVTAVADPGGGGDLIFAKYFKVPEIGYNLPKNLGGKPPKPRAPPFLQIVIPGSATALTLTDNSVNHNKRPTPGGKERWMTQPQAATTWPQLRAKITDQC